MAKQKKIVVVGAGLSGTLLAIRMAQRGHNVHLYESRSDMRLAHVDGNRSINLALSIRGINALAMVGIDQEILEQCIPMYGRLIHTEGAEARLSKYSGRENEYINSMSREGLNISLLNLAEKEGVHLYFDLRCQGVDLDATEVTFINKSQTQIKVEADLIFGADGAGSAVRRSFLQNTTKLLFNYNQTFLRHGYKELSIRPTEENDFRIEPNALHIWPRGQFMIIALPNLDKSFTVTMFHPYEGEAGFNTISTPEELQSMFEKYYPNLIELMPHYKTEYFENPVGTLGTIKCYPYQANGSVLLIGDAAHAIVPFYGQGMNASFEDVLVLDKIIEKYEGDWPTILFEYQEQRYDDAYAIADLALDNFYEMRDGVDDEDFIRKRKLEMKMEQQFDNYYSKYSLVTFRPEYSYSEAMIQGRKQDEFLLEICRKEENPDPQEVYNKLQKQDWYR